MQQEIILQSPNKSFSDLYFLFCGKVKCSPNHHFGPAVRPNYIIHVITKGKGTFTIKNHTYHLKQGDCFIIEPDTLTYYEADTLDPWEYHWIGFNGNNVGNHLQLIGVDITTPILRVDDPHILSNTIEQMLLKSDSTISNQFFLQGLLYYFLGYLEKHNQTANLTLNTHNDYVIMAISFIETHFYLPIKATDIAQHVNLDRSYIANLFKQSTGTTIKQYLTNFRISRARELIILTDLTVSQIAESCGYSNPLTFSKKFKKYLGLPPTEFRKHYHYSTRG